MLTVVAFQEKGLLDWCICGVIGWFCGRLGRANRLVTAGGDFRSVIVRVVSRQLTVLTYCYMGVRCSCGSVELTMARIWFVVADLAKRRVHEVRVRANYSIEIREGRGQYCHVLYVRGCGGGGGGAPLTRDAFPFRVE